MSDPVTDGGAAGGTAGVQKRTADLGTAPIVGLLVRLSVPSAVGMVVMSLYNLVDTFWVAGLPYGTKAIAALTILFPVQQLAGSLGVGAGVGVASLVSRRFGEDRREEVNAIAGNAVTLPLVLGVALAGLCLLVPHGLVRVFGAPEELADLSSLYLTTVAFGFPFLMFTMTASGLFRGSGDTVAPMVVNVAAACVNALLDPFLIYGWGPFPELGVQGAALATATSQLLGTAIAATYLWSRRSAYRVRARHLGLRLSILTDVAQVGAPATVMAWARSGVGILFNWVLAGFGPAAIAAQGITLRILMLVVSFIGAAVNQGLMPVIGYNFGARNYRRMWRAYLVAALGTSGLGLVLSTVTFIAAPQIVGVFTKDPELLALATLAFRLKIATLFLVEPQMMGMALLQGMGRGVQAMMLTLVRQVIIVVPALLLFSHFFGVTGAFCAEPTADVLALAIAGPLVWGAYRSYPPRASVTAKRGAETPAQSAATAAARNPAGGQ